MKIVSALVLFFLWGSFAFSQSRKPNLKITGTVEEIAMQERDPNTRKACYITDVKLKLKLKNTNSVSIIFLQQKPSVDFAVIVPFDKTKKVFLATAYNLHPSSNFLTEKDWENLKKTLDKEIPAPETMRIINPNEEIEFESFVRFIIPKVSYEENTVFFMLTSDMDFIKSHAPTQIETVFETWSTLALHKGSTEKRKAKFADKLRKKWKNIGYLWTEEIEAEPISIDFDSVIFKTLID